MEEVKSIEGVELTMGCRVQMMGGGLKRKGRGLPLRLVKVGRGEVGSLWPGRCRVMSGEVWGCREGVDSVGGCRKCGRV